MIQSPQSETNRVDARACASSYLVLGSMFFLLTLFGLLVAMKTPAHDWEFAYIPAGIGIGLVLWLRAIRLKIEDGELFYQTLFRARHIRVTDIEKVENRIIGTSKGAYRALVIYPLPHARQRPIRINIKPFSREDLSRLFDLLSPVFKGPRNIGIYTDETV